MRKTVEEMIEDYDKEVYGGNMPAHNKSVLRSMIEREIRQEETDKIHGYDDGEAELQANEF